jgi:hypothetical protein
VRVAAPNRRLAELSEADRRALESWLVEFDQHWAEGLLARRVAQIPGGTAWRQPALAEMVKIDLERQWQLGRRVSLDSYLEQFPDLGRPEDVSVDLIEAGYQVRRQFGAPAALPEYRRRFPGQAGALAQLIERSGSARSEAGAMPADLEDAVARPTDDANASMARLAAALTALLRSSSARPAPTEVPSTSIARRRKWVPLIVATAGLALVLPGAHLVSVMVARHRLKSVAGDPANVAENPRIPTESETGEHGDWHWDERESRRQIELAPRAD